LKRFVLDSRANADLKTTARYYEDQRQGLGREFLADFDETIARILAYPLAAPIADQQTRRARLKNFPFDVFYALRKEDFTVVAVMHRRRHPDSWKRRP
jgi:plasmid stabilization system protein ParE